jgi:hypothetical protein
VADAPVAAGDRPRHGVPGLRSGAVRKQAKRPSSNLREFVGSTPTRATRNEHASVGHWQAQVVVTHPPSGRRLRVPEVVALADGSMAVVETAGRDRLGRRRAAVVYGLKQVL